MSSQATSQPAPEASAQLIELPVLGTGTTHGPALLRNHGGLLDSVKVALSVVVGEAGTTLGELFKLQENAILTIDRQVGQPVDLVINNNVVARGQLVVVGDNFGVRITEIAQQDAA
jgi:flagellar motor switch protein FliN/FliY